MEPYIYIRVTESFPCDIMCTSGAIITLYRYAEVQMVNITFCTFMSQMWLQDALHVETSNVCML